MSLLCEWCEAVHFSIVRKKQASLIKAAAKEDRTIFRTVN